MVTPFGLNMYFEDQKYDLGKDSKKLLLVRMEGMDFVGQRTAEEADKHLWSLTEELPDWH